MCRSAELEAAAFGESLSENRFSTAANAPTLLPAPFPQIVGVGSKVQP